MTGGTTITERAPRQEAARLCYLPTELLAEIFQFACVTSSSSRPSTLKSLSHVCRVWRRVALGEPRLWTEIDYQHDHPDFVNEQLRRSGNLAVVVKAHFPMHFNRGLQNLRLALKESAIGTLDIQGPPEILDQVLQNLDAAFLKTLSLFVPSGQMPKDTPYPGPSFHLTAPQLRTLSLSNFVVPWDATIFSNLTHLRLHLQDPTFAPSMIQILGMLTSSPMLRELNLLHAIENSSRLPLESVAVVSVTHLATLLVDDDILNHIFLLRHIEIQTPCTMSLKVEHRGHNLIAELGRSVSPFLSFDELHRICVEGEPSRVTIRGYNSASAANPRVQIALRCPGSYSEREIASTAGSILSSLPLVATTALELVFCDLHSAVISVEAWQRCLQSLEAVESLQIKPTTPRNLLSALSVWTNDMPALLPRLQSLEIHHTDSSPASTNRSDGRKPAPSLGSWWQKIEVAEVTFFDTLLMCLKSRQQCQLGAQISNLRLARWGRLSEQQIHSLQSVVNDVSWSVE
ncbi:hypothetical protein DFH06DRAFT_1348269 [Mycena polygramma]|nr:hypothetical protein DFH06DRAFT_1348269 [Mycena polygramma]